VVEFNIDYVSSDADGDRRIGTIGRNVFSGRQGDAVRLQAKFDRPVYAYLIVLRGDGTADLCWPEDDSAPPPLATEARYPSVVPSHMYGLEVGVGPWAFLAVASSQPLPPYRDWIATLGSPPWRQQTFGSTATAWEFSPERVEAFTAESIGLTRGRGRVEVGSEPLLELMRWAQSDPRIGLVEGRAFLVQARH
jgi:hypothetical protein